MIYPSIVTTDGNHFKKLEEATKLGLEEVCFFATQLSLEERKNFYELLKESTIKYIPLVHVKEDMELWELDYFTRNFQTKLFNCHPQAEHKFKNNLSKYRKKIFVENTFFTLDENDVKFYAGVCIDFSHLETMRHFQLKAYGPNLKLIGKYHRGCGHISAEGKIFPSGGLSKIPKYFPFLGKFLKKKFSAHFLRDFNDLDYLERYQKYFPPIMALELENSLEEQLKIIDYLSSKTWASKV